MFSLKVLTILISIPFTFSAEKHCKTINACKCAADTGVVDLTSIGTPEIPRFHDVLFDTNCSALPLLYSYNPCYPFNHDTKDIRDKPGHEPCKEAAACIKTPESTGDPPEQYAIGLQKTAAFGYDDKEKLYVTYSVSKAEYNQSLQVFLICDETATKPNLNKVTPECEDHGVIVFNLISKCCCPGHCSSAASESKGLSTGSVLLIVFFTVLLAYLLVGIVWNFCNGSQGAELIPNLEFWNELPTLIMEGVIFTCTCFRGTTYGEV